MYDNTQQHTEIWNLVWCLVPLHCSKVVLKIIALGFGVWGEKSGIAAVCFFFILFCLDRLIACFPLGQKHFYDFFPLQWLVGKHICFLTSLDVNIIQMLSGTIPCTLYQVLATTLGVPDLQEALTWPAPSSHTFVGASTHAPAQQSSPLHRAASGPLAALPTRCDSDTASRRAGLAAPWHSTAYLNLCGLAQSPLQTFLTGLWVKVVT